MFFLLLIITSIFLTSCSKGSCDVCGAEPQIPNGSFGGGPQAAGSFFADSEPTDWQSFTVNGVTYGFSGNLVWQKYLHDWNYEYKNAIKFQVYYHVDNSYFQHYGITNLVIDNWVPIY